MTKEQLAEQLDGIEYLKEIPTELLREARKNNLVIIYGYSDDLVEIEGAIVDEISGNSLIEFYLGEKDILRMPDKDDFPEEDSFEIAILHYFASKKKAAKIKAKFGEDESYSWIIHTDAPHVSFNILDEGDLWCRALVIDLKEL